MKSEKKTIENIDKNNWNILITPILATLLLGIIAVSYIRENSMQIFPVTKYQTSKKNLQQWLKTIEEGDEKKAILYAEQIVPDNSPALPDSDYMQLLLNNKLSALVLTSPFNHFDYIRWKDAYEIKKITDNAIKNFKDPIPELFHQVLTKEKYNATTDSMSLFEMFQVKISQYKNTPYLSTIDIWKKGYASMEELCRLLSEIAYQMNFDVAIVGIYDKSFTLIHVFCEIRNKNKSYVCDPINRKIWKNTTVAKLAKNPLKIKGICSEKIIKAMKRRVYRIPAEAMDYKLYNQQLYQKLHINKIKDLPNFATSPQKRIEQYILNYENKTQKSPFLYWNFPFKLLMSSSRLPQNWKSPIINKLN